MKTVLAISVWFAACVGVAAQEKKPIQFQVPDAIAEKAKLAPEEVEKIIASMQAFSNYILIFAAALCVGVLALRFYDKIGETSTVRLLSLIFLAALACILIVAGFSQAQIGGAFALLGTLAGYVFGRVAESDREPPRS